MKRSIVVGCLTGFAICLWIFLQMRFNLVIHIPIAYLLGAVGTVLGIKNIRDSLHGGEITPRLAMSNAVQITTIYALLAMLFQYLYIALNPQYVESVLDLALQQLQTSTITEEMRDRLRESVSGPLSMAQGFAGYSFVGIAVSAFVSEFMARPKVRHKLLISTLLLILVAALNLGIPTGDPTNPAPIGFLFAAVALVGAVLSTMRIGRNLLGVTVISLILFAGIGYMIASPFNKSNALVFVVLVSALSAVALIIIVTAKSEFGNSVQNSQSTEFTNAS